MSSYTVSMPQTGQVQIPVVITLTATGSQWATMGDSVTISDGSDGVFGIFTIINPYNATVIYTPMSLGIKTLTFTSTGSRTNPSTTTFSSTPIINLTPITVTPYAQSGIVNNTQIFNLNYTNQDFWSMKTRLVNFIKERFGPGGTVLPNTFNDLVESDIAIMLIENWAFLADLLSFKMDQQANELYIDTVTEIDNAFRLAKLVGYQPQPPIAASAMFVATINNPILTDIAIATPYAIDISAQNSSVTIELFQADINNNPIFNQDIIIPAGTTSVQNIIGVQGNTRVETFTGTGSVAQSYKLTYSPVIFGSIMIQIDGIMWQQVDYFTDSQPRREYRIEYDSTWNAYIIFGNNSSGLIPSLNSAIQATYRVGGGVIGNIVTGYVTAQIQTSVPGLQFAVPISVTNYTAGNNGYDGDTIDDIRTDLPKFLRTQNRLVSGEDYKNFTDQFATPYNGKVGKSTAVLRNYGCAANVIDIYILALNAPNNLQLASNELKVELNEALADIKMMTDSVCIKDGSIINTSVTIDVTLDKFYKKFELEFRGNITQIMNSFFDLNNWDYGEALKNTDVVKALSNINEISDFAITFTTSDPNNQGQTITADFNEIIRPDLITIAFLYV